MSARVFRATAKLVLLAGAVLPLRAGNFAVNPVRVELSLRQLHSTLKIANGGDEKVTVQVHAVSWGKGGNDESLEDTNDVIVNPPIFTIAPHQTQLIRLGLREFKASAAEQTYRLIVEEVPPPLKPDFNGLRTLLRISIPVFVAPPQPAHPLLLWQVRSEPDGPILSVQNRGTGHIQLKQISVSRAPGGQPIFTGVRAVYVLPGGQAEWHINGVETGSGELLIRAATDHGPVSESLRLSQ